jgi:hypothetical protein
MKRPEVAIRLPSFNDFSPVILKYDMRIVLQITNENSGNKLGAVKQFARVFFGGVANKRSSTNIPTTLVNTGLIDAKTFALTDFGRRVLARATAKEAAQEFVRELLINRHGLLLVDAIRTIFRRKEAGSRKALLKRELENLGVKSLNVATTDHTTLENWFVEAGLVVGNGPQRRVEDNVLRSLVGMSSDDYAHLLSLEPRHRMFLTKLRRQQELAGPRKDIPVTDLYQECLREAPAYYREDKLRADVLKPLAEAGWLVASTAKSGKGGTIRASDKLLGVPLEKVLPSVARGIPPDLREHLTRPPHEICELLDDQASENNRGLGLELLALRMLLELNLEPQGFRLRSAETGHAEVDLQAEGTNLLFSRWVVQCKNVSRRVPLSDIAKEVGIAVHQKAHVVMVVTTSDFTADAIKFAKDVSIATHLQFLLIPGTTVREYLKQGPQSLLKYVLENAATVMEQKRVQALLPMEK